jgi:CMP-N,N'-diacetyllegionaminic acid synthase
LHFGQKVIGLIPARGGSKSIPGKNIATLKGRPLLSYVSMAAQASNCMDAVYCSTDDEAISNTCHDYGVETIVRPPELATDDSPVLDTMVHVLHWLNDKMGAAPDILVLLQPTSPFLLPGHIDELVEAMRQRPDSLSGQTVAAFPHNFHAYNQRQVAGGLVQFVFPKERAACYNKQTKPKFHIFGNLVASRARALLEHGQIFGEPSVAVEIPFAYALDVDGPDDLKTAEWYIDSDRVKLPHIKL